MAARPVGMGTFGRRADPSERPCRRAGCPARPGEPDRQLREALGRPALMLVGGAGTQRQDGRAIGDQAGAALRSASLSQRRGSGGGSRRRTRPISSTRWSRLPRTRSTRRTCPALQQAGDRRITQVDHEVPAGADGHQPQVQPVAVMLALFQDDDALDIGRFGQQRHRSCRRPR